MKKRMCFIPQRQINWKKYAYLRNKMNNIFYDCQCGKRYISFPAIYLHFQRKHKRKLLNIKEAPEYQHRKNEKQQVYFYFIDAKRQKEENSIEKQSKLTEIKQYKVIKHIFKNFRKQNKKQIKSITNLEYCQNVLTNLQIYIGHNSYQNSIQGKQISQNQLITNLALHFNNFAIHELNQKKLQKNQYYKLCMILLLLAEWLYTQNLSHFSLELNVEQEKE